MNAITRPSSLMRYVSMMHEAHRILENASKLPALPDLLRVQAESASRLAGMTLHRCRGEVATPRDAENLRTDLEVIARRIVDPLIEAIGNEAGENFYNIDAKAFASVLFEALHGGWALDELSKAARKLRDEREADRADYRNPGSHRGGE